MKKVVKQFKNDVLMTMWLSDELNLHNLKDQYPPEKYHAEVNLIDKQILVWEKP